VVVFFPERIKKLVFPLSNLNKFCGKSKHSMLGSTFGSITGQTLKFITPAWSAVTLPNKLKKKLIEKGVDIDKNRTWLVRSFLTLINIQIQNIHFNDSIKRLTSVESPNNIRDHRWQIFEPVGFSLKTCYWNNILLCTSGNYCPLGTWVFIVNGPTDTTGYIFIVYSWLVKVITLIGIELALWEYALK
jgi:hypothetical protein